MPELDATSPLPTPKRKSSDVARQVGQYAKADLAHNICLTVAVSQRAKWFASQVERPLAPYALDDGPSKDLEKPRFFRPER